jgi:hypothetical protein
MKKIFAMVLAVGLVFSAAAFAQDMGGASSAGKAAAAPLKTLKGTVKADGDKLTFVNDKDQKS